LLVQKKIYKALFIVLFLTVLSFEASAAVACSKKSSTPGAYVDRFWVADPPPSGEKRWWHDNANWSEESGGSPGASAPTNGCGKARFDGGSVVNASLFTGYRIHFLKIEGGYTGTIDLNGKHLKVTKNIATHGGTILVPTDSILQNWGDLYIYSGGTITASNAKLISVKKNVNIRQGGTFTAPGGDHTRFVVHGGFNIKSGGTFNHNNGTVNLATQYKGSCANTTATINIEDGPGTGRNFYNLYKSGKRHVYLNHDIKVENDLTNIGNGCIKAKNRSNTSRNITIGGDWYQKTTNNFQGSTGKVIFNGSSAQTIDSAANFTNVQISNSDVSLIKDTTITGTLTIDLGATLDLNGYNLTAGTLVNNGNLQLKGSETVTITTMDTDSGTVTYDGTGTYTQLAAGDTYFNLTLNSSGSITLDANLNVDGDLTITNGTLDVSTDNRSINVAGNWSNGDTFISRSGTVTFDGTSVIVTGGTGDSNDFYDVTLGGTSASQSTNAIAIDNDFEITSSGTWYTMCLAMTVSGDTTTGSGSIATTLAPSVSEFVPANSATGVAVSSNIELKFNTAIRNTDNSDISSSDLDTLITLKATDSSGSDIDFSASIDSENKIITINPDSNFSSKQVIYVAISTGVENSCGTALGSVASAIFTAADIEGPTHTWSPANSDTGVTVNSNITLTFNEAVVQNNVAGTVLTNSIVSGSGFITLKETNKDGSDIAFSATIDSDKEVITINPDSDFSSEQVIYVAIGTPVKDSSGNTNTDSSITFTAKDTITPTLTFSPLNGATDVAIDSVIELEFSEAMRRASDDATLTDSIAKGLITLKTTDSSGSDIDFGATYNSTTKTITITPVSDFSSQQVVYVAISNNVEDDANNAISLSSAIFTAREIGATDTTAPSITFLPADSATDIAKDSNITLTFTEAIRLVINNEEINNANVESLIDLRETNSSGPKISFAASIDTAKTVITINPTSDFSSEQVIYVGIEATVEDLYDNAISESSITFTAVDSISPTIVFDPTDLEDTVPVTDNITLTFSEAIRIIDSNTTLTSANVDALITLTDTDEKGSTIDFNATIDSDKKIITIDPDSSFSSEQTVYVHIGATVEDYADNAITESSITFVAVDSTAPSLDFTPGDSDTGIAVNSDITIAFDEPIRIIDNNETLNDSNVDALITLKTTDSSGTDIVFEAVIDDSKQLITISPTSDFSSEQTVYVHIGATVEDYADNAITESSITFVAADATAPTVAFVPPDSTNCVPISSNVSLTFSEAVRNANTNLEITSADLDTLITLDYTSDGSPVAFTATIDSDNKVITVNPVSDFVSGEVVNVAIDSVEDFSDNAMSATSGTFCVVDSTAPVLIFSPADSSTKVAADTNITLNFDEEIRLIINDADINNTNVDELITLKTTDSSGADIDFDATIDSDNQIITIDLVSDLSSNQIVYVAIGAKVEDSYNNAITEASATFTTGDSLPPTVVIEAVIKASIATDSDITFTFSEKIRLVLNNGEVENSDATSLLTLKDTDANGADIPFSATINSAKTVITINPTSNFSSQQIVYAEVPGNTFEDYSDNLVPTSSKIFIAEYLITELRNPLNEKDVVGLIEAQLETAERMIQHSTAPVLKRMEWLRRHRDENNLSHQGVKLKFVNSTLTDITNTFNLSSFINNTSDIFGDDWAIWSEGSVTIGEIDENTFSSIKGIKSSGITIGIDKIVDKNQMYGAAFRIENDDNDIGTSGTKLDTDGYSILWYGTFPFSDKTYIDSTLGIGLLRTELTRKHDSGTLSGKRKGEQVFGSILYGAEFNNNQLTLSPYGRLDAGYTKLKSYSDSGTVAGINYNEQKIKTARASIGLLVDDEVRIREITFMPNARIEYGKDLIDSSDAIVSYNVYPNTNYTLNIDKEETDNFRVGVGADIELDGGWLFMTDYERNQTESFGHENTLSMGVSFQPNSTSEYSFLIIDGNSSNRQIGLDFDKSLSDDWSVNASFEVAKISTSGYNNTVQFSTEMSF
jgi:methionine-rich copper-binding protein CopC